MDDDTTVAQHEYVQHEIPLNGCNETTKMILIAVEHWS